MTRESLIKDDAHVIGIWNHMILIQLVRIPGQLCKLLYIGITYAFFGTGCNEAHRLWGSLNGLARLTLLIYEDL